MKSNFIYTFFLLSIIAFLFTANSNGRASNGWGNTGAPGDEMPNGTFRTCQTCHGTGSANGIQVTQTFELTDNDGNDIFASGYTPGATYNAKLTVNAVTGNPALYGFQILCLNAAQDVIGPEVSNWTDISNNVAIRSAVNTNRTYAEHATASDSNIFSMTWVAPLEGAGEVTFYVVSNGVNDNNGTSGDGATGGKFTLSENTMSSAKDLELAAELSLFPNPVASDLSVRANIIESGLHEWAILDLQGRTLQNGSFDLPTGESVQNVTVADMAAGLYQFQLRKDGKIAMQTLVKK